MIAWTARDPWHRAVLSALLISAVVPPPAWLTGAPAAPAAVASGADRSIVRSLGDGKRSYELLLPTAETAPPSGSPLVAYLHPTGQAKPDEFKRDYWPLLAQRNCLAALPAASGKLTWRADDAQYVMDCLADAQKQYQTDPKRVILMGVSGGGQMALYLADRRPEAFAAVVVISTNPVVVRGRRSDWFYPATQTARTCPFMVINPITQGSAIQFWRQVRIRREPLGASISILPIPGATGHYVPPPKELPGWLDEVLAGKLPAPIPDPQKEAVAKMLAAPVAALPKAIQDARPIATTQPATARDAPTGRLSVPMVPGFERSKVEEAADAAGQPTTQVRLEHVKWPIFIRCDGRRTARPMPEVLKAEEAQTAERGLLYQVYHTGQVAAGGRTWELRIGSITYPDQRRGWVSALFLHAAATFAGDPKAWLEVLVLDETQQPDAGELAGILVTVLDGIQIGPAAATLPAGR